MNLFLFRYFYLAAPLTFGFSIAYGQLAPPAQNTGPIIVNYPVEKTSVTTNEVKKTPSKKSTVSTSSSTPSSGSDSAGTLPTALSNAPVLKTSSPSSLVPDETSLAPGEEVIQAVKRGNDTIDRVNKRDGYCELCEIQRHLAEGRASEVQNKFKAKEANREGEKVAPSQDKNNAIGARSQMCGSREGGYDVCIYSGDVSPGVFKITNGDPGGKSREWHFNYENRARQDLGFSITDVSANGRQTNETYMMVFPRKFLPSIRISGNTQVVTLPTGETVTYDIATKKIISGVLNEQKNYSGNGVVVRADQTGSNEARFGKGQHGSATIIKSGKSCQVPKKDLWPDQTESSALHFKFATDEDFDEYLKKKCGFGV